MDGERSMSWARFVLLMRQRGVTHLLHEVNTYDIDNLTMHLYAEVDGKCIGTYNPNTEIATVLQKPWRSWSKRDRKFTKVKIK